MTLNTGTTTYHLYRTLTGVSEPLLRILLKRRLKAGKEDAARLPERMGQASRPRPTGHLVWLHAASVGESLSLISLIRALLDRDPKLFVMVTTGTVTSARLMTERLPERAFHQFFPIDHPRWAARFLDHWRPDFVLWAESELWPNMLSEISARDTPAVLINARMSARSFQNWGRLRNIAAFLMEKFTLCLAQNEDEAARYRALGARRVEAPGNLKYASAPLPYEAEALEKFKTAVRGRPTWLFASTHPGEEDIAANIHKRLKKDLPNILTVIVPRHPKRGAEIESQIHGLSVARRAAGKDVPSAVDDIYIADTLGELGLFFRAVPLSVIGGSFVPHGGHNPIEPGQLGSTIFYGPHMHNFETICHDFESAGAARALKNTDELAAALLEYLKDPAKGQGMADAARSLTHGKAGIVNDILKSIIPLLDKDLA